MGKEISRRRMLGSVAGAGVLAATVTSNAEAAQASATPASIR